MSERAHAAPPLRGVRVLDLTRLLPGPLSTMHLADMGADVIKVEDTGAGDYAPHGMRRLLQRNKRAVRIDLKQQEGVKVLLRLAAKADVLVEGFRPGVMDRLGIGYAALSKVNPRLVYCSITGYGQTGPARGEPGHDLNYCARAGVTAQIGTAPDKFALSNLPIADVLGGGLTSVMGILAALFDSMRTGYGRHVDISMADSVLAHNIMPLATRANLGAWRPAGRDKLTGAVACYGLYRTQDGRHLAVGALERKFWDAFCTLIDREDLQERHLPADEADIAEVRGIVADIIGSQPMSHWERVFAGNQCCVSAVLTPEEALADPLFRARGMVLDSAEPNELPQLACPVKMTDFDFAITRAAPKPGEHTDEILCEAGFEDAERASLRAMGAIA